MDKGEKTYESLPAMLEASAEEYGDKLALGIANGIEYSYNEINKIAGSVATMLYASGLEKGDNIAIIGENSPHWVSSYFGIQRAGGTAVPILTDFSATEMYAILEHAEARMVFISQKQLDKFPRGFPSTVKFMVTLEDLQISEAGTDLPSSKKNADSFEKPALKDGYSTSAFPKIDKDDVAVIIYTSGTTGKSKGVMLTHENILFDAIKTGSIHQVVHSDVFLSVLPLAHTYEATIGMVIPLMNGASVHYIDRAPTASYLGPILQKYRPTTMLTVPLIIEKIYKSKIKPGIQESALLRTLTKVAPMRKLIYRSAGRKLLSFFGGRIRFFGIGGAPLAPEVEKFLIEAGFPYAIGYGLTETAPMLAGFGPDDAVYRSVGKVMEGVDIRIDNPDPRTGEGEILAMGKNIMKGYYKNPGETKKVFSKDGYFRTGDLGLLNDKGILYIKGRSKNMILGANGENIYPEEIESVINENEYVQESLVMQMKGKLIARVHLNMEHLEEKFNTALEDAHDKQVMLNEKIDEYLNELKEQVNLRINKNSRLQLVLLQADPFEKTPTMKIKRFMYK